MLLDKFEHIYLHYCIGDYWEWNFGLQCWISFIRTEACCYFNTLRGAFSFHFVGDGDCRQFCWCMHHCPSNWTNPRNL